MFIQCCFKVGSGISITNSGSDLIPQSFKHFVPELRCQKKQLLADSGGMTAKSILLQETSLNLA